jgi:large subunit ribosomal protein L21
MHAVIRTGGKQYYVTAGDIVEVDKLAGNIGETIALTDVLMIAGNGDVTVGQPIVEGAIVNAKITGQYRGEKIIVFRYRPKKRIRVRKGHRQYLTRLHVQSIRLADGTEFQIAARESQVTSAVVEEPVVIAPLAAEEPVVNESVIEEPMLHESITDEVMVDDNNLQDASTDSPVESGDNDEAATAEAKNKE